MSSAPLIAYRETNESERTEILAMDYLAKLSEFAAKKQISQMRKLTGTSIIRVSSSDELQLINQLNSQKEYQDLKITFSQLKIRTDVIDIKRKLYMAMGRPGLEVTAVREGHPGETKTKNSGVSIFSGDDSGSDKLNRRIIKWDTHIDALERTLEERRGAKVDFKDRLHELNEHHLRRFAAILNDPTRGPRIVFAESHEKIALLKLIAALPRIVEPIADVRRSLRVVHDKHDGRELAIATHVGTHALEISSDRDVVLRLVRLVQNHAHELSKTIIDREFIGGIIRANFKTLYGPTVNMHPVGKLIGLVIEELDQLEKGKQTKLEDDRERIRHAGMAGERDPLTGEIRPRTGNGSGQLSFLDNTVGQETDIKKGKIRKNPSKITADERATTSRIFELGITKRTGEPPRRLTDAEQTGAWLPENGTILGIGGDRKGLQHGPDGLRAITHEVQEGRFVSDNIVVCSDSGDAVVTTDPGLVAGPTSPPKASASSWWKPSNWKRPWGRKS